MMRKKLGLAVLYGGIAFIIYKYGEAIFQWFHQTDQVALVMIMATVMAFFPAIPYPIVGGVIGAAFGPGLGAWITWVGSAAASILMFLFVRYGYQDLGLKVLHLTKGVRKLTELFEKNAFLAILFCRMIPVVPSILVNIYSALSRVSFGAYAAASSLGKLPSMLLFAVVGDNLMTDPAQILYTLSVYAAFFAVTSALYFLWKKVFSMPPN